MDKRSKEQMPKAASTTALGWRSNCRTASMLKKGFFQLRTSVLHFTINITFSPCGAYTGLSLRQVYSKMLSLIHTGEQLV